MKISIITVTYNAEKHLEKCIQSIISQKNPNFEYIIIDGGSTDGTVDIIKKYQDHLAYWVSEPDCGIYDAMNKGIKQAKGGYIGFLGADDYFFPNMLQTLFENIVLYKDVDFWVAPVKVNKIIKSGYKPSYQNPNDAVSTHSLGLWVKTYVFKDLNYFSLDYRICSDADFIAKLISKNFKGMTCQFNNPIGEYSTFGCSATLRYTTNYELYLVRRNSSQGSLFLLIWLCYKQIRSFLSLTLARIKR